MPDGLGIWLDDGKPRDRSGILQSEKAAKEACDGAHKSGRLTHAHILNEEFYEAMAAGTSDDLRDELVQVAAVAVKWIQCIDRRKALPTVAVTVPADGGAPIRYAVSSTGAWIVK